MPRIAPAQQEKTIEHGKDVADEMDPILEHCIKELTAAVEIKDIQSFRAALEALILNCFDQKKEENG